MLGGVLSGVANLTADAYGYQGTPTQNATIAANVMYNVVTCGASGGGSSGSNGGGGGNRDPFSSVNRKIAGTQGLEHSFDRHAAQWFGRPVLKETHLVQWQSLIEHTTQSRQIFLWTTGNSRTVAHLARVDGKYFVVQFFLDGPREGELATAFVPSQSQLSAMFRKLESNYESA